MPDRASTPGQSTDVGCPVFVSEPVESILTSRQRQALGLAAKGWKLGLIARLMAVSPGTARAHLVGARRRLRAQNTTHAVAIALSRKLITFNERDLIGF